MEITSNLKIRYINHKKQKVIKTWFELISEKTNVKNKLWSRNKSSLDFSLLTKIKPERSLTVANHRAKGRNNQGRYL